MSKSHVIVHTILIGACLAAFSHAASAGAPNTVVVQTASNLGQLTPLSVGINAAAWDSHLVDASIPALLANANLGVIRYPGGSTSNNYHWLSNTPDDPAQGGTVASANFDAYMAVVAVAGAQSMITVNYGSGSP